jgi:hypothetical protein
MYADDTICISEDTRAMNMLLAGIEEEGARFGLKLNKEKCEVLDTGHVANIHFADGIKVKQKDEVKYLGCHLNKKADVDREIKQKIGICMSALKSLDTFWRHSNCPKSFKLIAQDAVIRSKLLYGLESAELTNTQLKKLDVFQLKGLRKILGMDTTFVNRANTNQLVYMKANEAIRTDRHQNKEIVRYSAAHKQHKLKLMELVITEPDDSPMKQVTFDPNTFTVRDHGKRRSGRPKAKWFEEGKKELWEAMKKDMGEPYKHQQWDNLPNQIAALKKHTLGRNTPSSRGTGSTQAQARSGTGTKPRPSPKWYKPEGPHFFSLADAGLHVR